MNYWLKNTQYLERDQGMKEYEAGHRSKGMKIKMHGRVINRPFKI